MRRSATSGHPDTSAALPFKIAAELVCKAWRRRYGRLPPPPLSHALSSYIDGIWTIKDAEAGVVVAVVQDSTVVLDEDVIVEDQ